MGVFRDDAVAVRHLEHVAIAALDLDAGHRAAGGRDDRRAHRCAHVNALVRPRHVQDGVQPAPRKMAREPARGRHDRRCVPQPVHIPRHGVAELGEARRQHIRVTNEAVDVGARARRETTKGCQSGRASRRRRARRRVDDRHHHRVGGGKPGDQAQLLIAPRDRGDGVLQCAHLQAECRQLLAEALIVLDRQTAAQAPIGTHREPDERDEHRAEDKTTDPQPPHGALRDRDASRMLAAVRYNHQSPSALRHRPSHSTGVILRTVRTTSPSRRGLPGHLSPGEQRRPLPHLPSRRIDLSETVEPCVGHGASTANPLP